MYYNIFEHVIKRVIDQGIQPKGPEAIAFPPQHLEASLHLEIRGIGLLQRIQPSLELPESERTDVLSDG